MELYGYRIQEQSLSMQKKAYYCRIRTDSFAIADKMNYYGAAYIHKGSIKRVINDIFADRKQLYAPVCQYITHELQAHGIYHYTTDELLNRFDTLGGNFLNSYLDLCETCFEIVQSEENARKLRELRKRTRSKISALGSDVESFVTASITAETINLAAGIAHSAVNAIGNAISALERANALESCYQSSSTCKSIQSGLQKDCKLTPFLVAQILSEEIGDEWRYPFTLSAFNEARGILENARKGQIPKSEQNRLIVDCIINKAPYLEDLYLNAEQLLGGDNGNLLRAAEFFSVAPYVEKCKKEEQRQQYDQRCKTSIENFFGQNLSKAEAFLDNASMGNVMYSSLQDVLNTDFDQMLSYLLTRTHYRKGKEVPILSGDIKRHLVLFAHDFTLMSREREIKKYCDRCHVKLQKGEVPYYFMDTTYFATREEGLVATNYGLYFSTPKRDNPLFYRNITALQGGMLDSMDIIYNGKDAKVHLLCDSWLNEFLAFTCAYFKYGQF